MLVALLAYLGGILTIVSPCILPVLPFVFARADRSFWRSTVPMLLGMAAMFAAVASLAAVGGAWAVDANEYGRMAALIVLGGFGLALLWPGLAERLASPLVAVGNRMSGSRQAGQGVVSSFVLGIAVGLLWAPCAGPILGLILTGAALEGANATTTLLLAAYAAGAATSLAAAVFVGGRVFAAMKRSLGIGEWLRRALGAAVLAGVVAIALGLDTGLLTRLSLQSTATLEQSLIDAVQPPPGAGGGMTMSMQGSPTMQGSPSMQGGPSMQGAPAMQGGPSMMSAGGGHSQLPVEGTIPPLTGAVAWLNSPPLTPEALAGKVVLVDFWTYSCINCLRALPYVKAWWEKYKDHGLVVIGVHTPEFAFEKDIGNVRKALLDLGVAYPVAIDNDYALWRAFQNHYWPAHYFIDAKGQFRHHHFGEGDYAGSEQVIRQLLTEAGWPLPGEAVVTVAASGAEAASQAAEVASPETYIGLDRAENFASPGGEVKNVSHRYEAPAPKLNQWGLAGDWTVSNEDAVLDAAGGSIVYRFHARDLHLVLGSDQDGKPVRFRVRIDGAAPGPAHGVDAAPDGSGTVTEHRLYQLVRQSGQVADHTFEIEFLDPGVHAYTFTFG
jgi:cytochrome c biogenesis protein CcdA/thiol-disulfide isomerase/thioredoxin